MNATVQNQKVVASEWVRSLIVKDLAEKSSRNPRYSLRRHATSLGISHALLSLVLSGKRNVTRQLASQVVQKVGGAPEEFNKYYPAPYGSDEQTLESSTPIKDDGFAHMSLADYALISDWYYFAILSLLEIKGAKWESAWIANRLGISEAQALSAMKLLERHELVAKSKTGRWKQTGRPIKVENTVSTEITRKAHRQILEKAQESLEMDPIEVRDFSYCTFAMDESLVPQALKEIRTFRRELMEKLEAKGKPTRVYNLSVQLFPTSKGVKK